MFDRGLDLRLSAEYNYSNTSEPPSALNVSFSQVATLRYVFEDKLSLEH